MPDTLSAACYGHLLGNIQHEMNDQMTFLSLWEKNMFPCARSVLLKRLNHWHYTFLECPRFVTDLCSVEAVGRALLQAPKAARTLKCQPLVAESLEPREILGSGDEHATYALPVLPFKNDCK